MLCPNCDKEIPEGKKFCGFCGVKLEAQDPEAPGLEQDETGAFDDSAPTTIAPHPGEDYEPNGVEEPTTTEEQVVDKKIIPTLYDIALMYENIGNHERALEFLDQVRVIYPDFRDVNEKITSIKAERDSESIQAAPSNLPIDPSTVPQTGQDIPIESLPTSHPPKSQTRIFVNNKLLKPIKSIISQIDRRDVLLVTLTGLGFFIGMYIQYFLFFIDYSKIWLLVGMISNGAISGIVFGGLLHWWRPSIRWKHVLIIITGFVLAKVIDYYIYKTTFLGTIGDFFWPLPLHFNTGLIIGLSTSWALKKIGQVYERRPFLIITFGWILAWFIAVNLRGFLWGTQFSALGISFGGIQNHNLIIMISVAIAGFIGSSITLSQLKWCPVE